MPHVIPQKRDQLKVRISERAYRRIVGYACRYANNSLNSKNWREVYGILIGTLEEPKGEVVNILDAIPMVVGDRAGVKFEARQYVDLASIDASLFEKSTKLELTQFLVGWWHTHPGFGFFFSQVDTLTQLGYQIANPNAVGLIFDHTQLGAFDCGVECLRLDDPTALMKASHDFVVFELENYEILLSSIEKWVEQLQPKLKTAEKTLTYVDGYLRRKLFAQLQRSFGILLVKKNLSKDEKREILGEDEETWVWDEKYIETMYRIPKFRKKIEHMLENAKNSKQKKIVAMKVHQLLQRPNTLFRSIVEAFWNRLNSIANVYFYLDTSERQAIETFDQRLREYGKILNSLLNKTKEMLGEQVRIPTRTQHAPKKILGEGTISNDNATMAQDLTGYTKTERKELNTQEEVKESTNIRGNIALKANETPSKREILKTILEKIRNEKMVRVSNVAEILKIPSKIVWEFLVELDIDGGIECEFDGELFTLKSDIQKFNAVIEEKYGKQELQ